jgi:hypothetical protein
MKKLSILFALILTLTFAQLAMAQKAKPAKKNSASDASKRVDDFFKAQEKNALDAERKEFEEWKKSKAKGDKIALSEKESKELTEWANTINQLETELEKVKKELSETAIGQKYEAINAKLNLAKSNYSLSFLLACSEHGIKATECKLSPDGKGVEKITPEVPVNK